MTPSPEDRLVAFGAAERPTEGVNVIVPVYGGATFVRRCLASLLSHTPSPHRIVLIDDASPDAETQDLLDETTQAWRSRTSLVRNERNLGFVQSVNLGFALDPSRDVVVLNSDTEVAAGWLDGLIRCAYSAEEIGTCSPLTSSGTVFAVPVAGSKNPLPEGWTVEDVARAVRRLSRRTYPRFITSNGFCMYVKRRYLEDVGYFDAEAFGRGYGEENDLCLRGVERGWTHAIDDATFVFHAGSMSFSDEKESLAARHREILDARYPYYTERIRAWMDADPLDELRGRLAAAMKSGARPEDGRLRLFFLIHDGRGGVYHTNLDLVRALAPRHDVFVLVSNRRRLRLERHLPGGRIEERHFELQTSVELVDLAHGEYLAVLEGILDEVRPDVVHVRHLLAHVPRALDRFKARGIPIVLSFHDHYTICPTLPFDRQPRPLLRRGLQRRRSRLQFGADLVPDSAATERSLSSVVARGNGPTSLRRRRVRHDEPGYPRASRTVLSDAPRSAL
ncbi:MAG: glycosyltransferase [Myxococcales bacterium]|nr:glycosyltransferase [Myxococcales bacterium]